MSTSQSDTPHERANRLYWETDTRVDEIAAEVGMSRSALYNAVQPLAAGVACADCGEPAVFPNRTRRDAGEAVCSACGVVAPTVVLRAQGAEESAMSTADAEDDGSAPARAHGWKEALPEVTPERAALIGGAAALGAALGTVAVRAIRRK